MTMKKRPYPKPDRAECTLESEEQQTFIQWVRMNKCRRRELSLMFSVPNGAPVTEFQRARLVSEGLSVGVPDMLLPVARGRYHGLAIEMKRMNGGVLRPEQARWLDSLRREGWYAVVCAGAGNAINTTTAYLDLGEFGIDAPTLDFPTPDILVDTLFAGYQRPGAGCYPVNGVTKPYQTKIKPAEKPAI